MLLAEELLLLLLDDEKGTVSATAANAGLAGALLLDLVEAGRLNEDLSRIGSEPSEPALAAAWRAIDEPKPAKHWVSKLPGRLKPIKGTIADGLVARGVLDERRHKTLGLFSSTRYPELDPGPETELRARLRRVLVDGAEPDPRTVSLLGLLVPLDLVKRVVSRGERKAAVARAKALAERGAVGDAVGAAVEAEVMAAVMAAITASTAATISAGGN
jgi:hypothetical protein